MFAVGMDNIGTIVVFNDDSCAISSVSLVGLVVEIFSYSGDEPYNVIDSLGLGVVVSICHQTVHNLLIMHKMLLFFQQYCQDCVKHISIQFQIVFDEKHQI